MGSIDTDRNAPQTGVSPVIIYFRNGITQTGEY